MSLGHACVDMNQGALPAILPFLIAAGGLNYAQAAGLTFAVAVSASMIQPIFGIIADKRSYSWLLSAGVFLGGMGISLIGFFPNQYWLMAALGLLSGIGIAAYHPEAARMVNQLAGKKKGSSMSFFSVGGTLGVAAGPMIATTFLLSLGLKGSAFLVILPAAMAAALIFAAPKIQTLAATAEAEEKKTEGVLRNEWPKFLYLCIAIFSRSIIAQSVNTFLPLYWLNVLNQSKAASGMVLSFMLFFGAIASIAGGHLADRFGLNRVLKAGWILLIPTVFFFTYISNPILAMLMLIPMAFGNFLTMTPMIVLNQKYLPKNIGFASGITMGLGVSLGGMVTPLLGNFADHYGLTAALKLLTVLPFIGAFVALTIKPPAKQ